MPFACSICEQESTRICAYCTKDACDNHICQHCGCCSDCCDCEVPLDEATAHAYPVPPPPEPVATPEPVPAIAPEPVSEAPATPVDQHAESEEPCAGPLETPEI